MKFAYSAYIEWSSNGTTPWNEHCARLVEVFGLPGQRYCTSPNEWFLRVDFRDQHDRLLFLTGWPAQLFVEDRYAS